VIHKGYHPWAATKKWEAYSVLNKMMVFNKVPLFKDIHLEVYKLYIYLMGIYQVKQ